jgi:hypothetical protein
MLRGRERAAAATPSAARDSIRELCQAAANRAVVATELVDGRAASALALYREAALLYAAAVVATRTGEPVAEPLRAEDIATRFRALELDEAPGVRAEAEAFLAKLAAPDVLAGDRVDANAGSALGAEASRVVRWLAGLVEPRTVAEIRLARRTRVGLAATAGVGLLVLFIGSLVSTENVALHKPVQISASHPQSVSPPSGFTDGVKTGAYGIETTVSDAPWVQVDLEAPHTIDRILVYNRGDTAFDAGLPMTLQCSTDGASFVDLDKRATSFSQAKPWVAKAAGRVCRYVRIRAEKGRYIALAEIEVFGRKK